MSRTLAHQDASGAAGSPFAVFHNSVFVVNVDTKTDPYGYATIERLAAERGVDTRGFEALTCCINHPTQSAVDCLTCNPLED